jgi:hypothetical protein
MSEPALMVPPIRSAIVDAENLQNGPTTSRNWYLFFTQARDSIAGLLTDVAYLLANAVKGAPNLLRPNIVPKVGPEPGTLVESIISEVGGIVGVNTMSPSTEYVATLATGASGGVGANGMILEGSGGGTLPRFLGRRYLGSPSAPTAALALTNLAQFCGQGYGASGSVAASTQP